ncbi:ABC transporter permease [Agrobacterium pusense]|uniref:ABC transporter permease n=1 Tax=Agrobacterium pusense TaxID=648995 RepID=UPI0010BED765|nr:ABC transporter permease [Agrobacterium pusense]MBW9077642.1 ABC transporter permease [Agrobacterium pusense]MDH0113338.1 ABC transporter permease [Agrobacterium pusense]QCL83954.1 ABC transporter permease [Agrobacterium pusense]
MWIQILQRFLILCLMLAIVSVIAFLLPYMAGGDPARTILFSRMHDTALDPHAVEALRTSLGLDRPLYVQYFAWLSNALRGDLGFSFTSSQPVAGELLRSLGVSVTLALTALAIAVAVALPLGTLAAMRPGGRLDNFATLMIQTFVATPEYWFAPMSALVFALYLGWLPSAGWDSWRSLVLPALTLTLRPLAYFTQVTRAAMAEVLRAPYITAARSRGLGMHGTVMRHGIRNGSLPVVTFFALWLAGLLGGSVVVEVIFAIPGMGRLLYDAVVNRDIPMLQGGFICIVALSILINTLADSFYVLINPAMRGRHDH